MSDYFDLGGYARQVTTSSPEAQDWFTRGLLWAYAFNHEEAAECFGRAAEADPGCALAHWGLAYALKYRSGNFEAAFGQLRRAVELDDGLPYDEPWGWMQPARHALGALLLEQGRAEEAEAVYRADLGLDDTLARPCQHPGNVWSLHGYHECLTRLGKHEQAGIIGQQLRIAVAYADVPIRSSCFCRLTPAGS
jgi:tetratricopeptide (TPR) repeat protein